MTAASQLQIQDDSTTAGARSGPQSLAPSARECHGFKWAFGDGTDDLPIQNESFGVRAEDGRRCEDDEPPYTDSSDSRLGLSARSRQTACRKPDVATHGVGGLRSPLDVAVYGVGCTYSIRPQVRTRGAARRGDRADGVEASQSWRQVDDRLCGRQRQARLSRFLLRAAKR
jgi:hypothetical protein